jgi:hypothetical protein
MSPGPRIGYVPFNADLTKPGDRRRFVGYARRRGLNFELAVPSEKYDLVVLSQFADITAWMDYPHGKIIYDLIDSYLAVPRSNWKQVFRGPAKYFAGQFQGLALDYKGAVQNMCRRAEAVVCTTLEQQAQIQRFCPNVHLVLDFHSTVTRRQKQNFEIHTPIRIAWEGLGVNVVQLTLISELLKTVAINRPITLVLVTDPVFHRWMNKVGRVDTAALARKVFEPFEIHAWTESACADVLCECDIGVIPLDLNDKLVAGKPENKLLLLWRMGLPVIVSATPAYARAMAAAGTPDLACTTPAQWLNAMRTLIESEEERRTAGTLGRRLAERDWNESVLLGRWDKAMASVGIDVANAIKT